MENDPVCGMQVLKETALVTVWEGRTYYFCSEGCQKRFAAQVSSRDSATRYDLVIIGGGPAGLTAATFAATMKLKACMICRDLGGQAIDSTRIENYMGFDFITGPELIARFRHQLIRTHYIDHLMAGVKKLEPAADGFRILTDGGVGFHGRAVLLATGMNRRKLEVPGEEAFQRRGIFYGQIPDFSFVQEEEAAVIGGGNTALQLVESLQKVARRVHLVSRGELTADAGVRERILASGNQICHTGYETLAFTGEKVLTGVHIRHLETGQTLLLPVRGAFIAIGQQPNSVLAKGLAELNERGEVLVGPDCATSRPGLFAAGDVTDVFAKRIIIASGEGAKAALAARKYLLHR